MDTDLVGPRGQLDTFDAADAADKVSVYRLDRLDHRRTHDADVGGDKER